MNSAQSQLENKGIDPLYHKNKVKSISFLLILSGVLLLTILLSLRAGSYETLIGELVKGITNDQAREVIKEMPDDLLWDRLATDFYKYKDATQTTGRIPHIMEIKHAEDLTFERR